VTTAVAIAITSPIVREGVGLLLSDAGVRVVESVDSTERLRLVDDPVVVVVELTDGDPAGEHVRTIFERSPRARVVGLHDGLGAHAIELAQASGVSVLVDVTADSETLVAAVSGDLDRTRRRWEPPRLGPPPLSERELQVLAVLARGATLREAGDELGISARSVERARANLIRKLGVRDQAQAVALALREGLIEALPPVTHGA
jgi:DNA-binding NarL/FixJ family response regulator